MKKRYYIALAILLAGFIFILFFSYSTSPLFPWFYGWDSSFFQYVGSGMTKNRIPYRDFFDMKGPWLFFLEYIGQIICYGRTGSFIVQLISLGISLFICLSTFKKYYGGGQKGMIHSFLSVLPLFVIMASTMEGGNLTEELSLPFLLWCLYLSMDYIDGNRNEHEPRYAVAYGFCFGIIMLSRITNAVLICAIVLTIVVFLIKNKKWKNIGWNALAFIIGVILAFIPPLFYYAYYGAVKEMLYCTFVFGFVYGTESFGMGTGVLFLLLLFVPILVYLAVQLKNPRKWMLVIVNLLGMSVTLGMGNSTLHDYLLVIPVVLLGTWELMAAFDEMRRMRQIKTVFLLGMAGLLFLYPGYKLLTTGKDTLARIGDRSAYDNVVQVAAMIPEEDHGSVLGYEVPMRWYAISDIMPSSRYCGWQEHYMELSPDVEKDIEDMFLQKPPKWMVTKSTAEIKNEMVLYQLTKNFRLVKENDDLKLYQRIEK